MRINNQSLVLRLLILILLLVDHDIHSYWLVLVF